MKKLLFLLLLFISCSELITAQNYSYIDNYNVVWNTPSVKSNGSMPPGGHDIGCKYKDVLIPVKIVFPVSGKRASMFDYEELWVDLTKPGDRIEPHKEYLIWYQYNNDRFSAFDMAVKEEGLEKVKDSLWNPLQNLFPGGMLTGDNLIFSDTSGGIYVEIPFRSWNYHSLKPVKRQLVTVFTSVKKFTGAGSWKNDMHRQANEKTEKEDLWRENTIRANCCS